jgi:hypothetical protein
MSRLRTHLRKVAKAMNSKAQKAGGLRRIGSQAGRAVSITNEVSTGNT